MPTRTARKKRRGLFVAVAAVVLVAIGALGIDLATRNTATTPTAATSVPSTAVPSAATASAAAKASASAAAKASAAASASASAAAQASQAAAKAPAQHVTSLRRLRGGIRPQWPRRRRQPRQRHDAIARDASQPWSTQWYSTPTFGLLKHGTGLLLDLGGKVTVTGLRLDLAQYQGADLQLGSVTAQHCRISGSRRRRTTSVAS